MYKAQYYVDNADEIGWKDVEAYTIGGEGPTLLLRDIRLRIAMKQIKSLLKLRNDIALQKFILLRRKIDEEI